MKRIIFTVILFLTLFSMSGYAQENTLSATPVSFQVLVNGKEATFRQPIFCIQNRTYVPLREVAETLGMNVNWNDEKKEITIEQATNLANNKEITDENSGEETTTPTQSDEVFAKIVPFKIIVNGSETSFQMPVVTIVDKTYLPLREVAETLGLVVDWNDETKVIEINHYEDKDLFYFRNDGYEGFMDKKGKVIIEPTYITANPFSEGLSKVTAPNGLYGYIDTSGKTIIPFQYPHGYWFSEGLASVSYDHSYMTRDWFYIDKNGKKAFDQEFLIANNFSEGYAAVVVDLGVDPFNGYLKWSYINKQGEPATSLIFDQAYDFHDGVACVFNHEKWGLINSTFELVVDYNYDIMSNMNEGLIAVKKDSKWGYIDSKGDVVLDFIYNYAGDFSEGLACVRVNDESRYIDKSGNTVLILPSSCKGQPFSEGIAIVTKKSGESSLDGAINKNGEFIVQPVYNRLLQCENGLMQVWDPIQFLYYINTKGEIIKPILTNGK